MRLVAFLLFTLFVVGQTATPTGKNRNQDIGLGIDAHGRQGAVDILSDTQGVDFRPYMQRLLENVRANWYQLIPKCAETMKGKLAIEFAIHHDGRVADMRLVATSGETVLDRAAWGSIAHSSPLPPLPNKFNGPYLALRLRFYYNPDKSDSPNKKCDEYPQETSSPAKTESGIAILISAPNGVRVPLGASRPVRAVVTGTVLRENGVEWRISGFGCSGAACGEMTSDSYHAPTAMPNPPYVTLTAISKSDPSAEASITLHIIDSNPAH